MKYTPENWKRFLAMSESEKYLVSLESQREIEEEMKKKYPAAFAPWNSKEGREWARKTDAAMREAERKMNEERTERCAADYIEALKRLGGDGEWVNKSDVWSDLPQWLNHDYWRYLPMAEEKLITEKRMRLTMNDRGTRFLVKLTERNDGKRKHDSGRRLAESAEPTLFD